MADVFRSIRDAVGDEVEICIGTHGQFTTNSPDGKFFPRRQRLVPIKADLSCICLCIMGAEMIQFLWMFVVFFSLVFPEPMVVSAGG